LHGRVFEIEESVCGFPDLGYVSVERNPSIFCYVRMVFVRLF